MIIRTLKIAKRWIMIVFGFTLLILGIVLAIPGVPGPGIVVFWAGLAILAVEFIWARKLLKKFEDQGSRLRDQLFGGKKCSLTQSKPMQKLEPEIPAD